MNNTNVITETYKDLSDYMKQNNLSAVAMLEESDYTDNEDLYSLGNGSELYTIHIYTR